MPLDPDDAFEVFTRDIGVWWRKEGPYWHDRSRRPTLSLERRLGGRLVELYDAGPPGTGFLLGLVTEWRPGARLAFQWFLWPGRRPGDVAVAFEAAPSGTHVRLEHAGFSRLGPVADSFRSGYAAGWTELLGWFAEHARRWDSS